MKQKRSWNNHKHCENASKVDASIGNENIKHVWIQNRNTNTKHKTGIGGRGLIFIQLCFAVGFSKYNTNTEGWWTILTYNRRKWWCTLQPQCKPNRFHRRHTWIKEWINQLEYQIWFFLKLVTTLVRTEGRISARIENQRHKRENAF